jgi:hypothetical protein
VQTTFSETANKRRNTEPTVEDDIAPTRNNVSDTIDHREQNVGSLEYGFKPSFSAIRTFIDVGVCRAEYCFRTQQGEIKRNKGDTVGKGESEKSEAVKITLSDVVIDFRDKFKFFTSIFIVNGVVDDEDFTFVVGSESGNKNDDLASNKMQKASPIVVRRIEESVGGIASEINSRILSDGKSPKVTLLKNDEKKGSKNNEKANSLRLYPATSKKSEGQRDEFGEGGEFGKAMDILVFMFYNHGKAPLLLDFLFVAKLLSNN